VIVATDVFEDIQGKLAAAIPEPVNCDVEPTHASRLPLIVGKELTVKVTFA